MHIRVEHQAWAVWITKISQKDFVSRKDAKDRKGAKIYSLRLFFIPLFAPLRFCTSLRETEN